MGVFHTIAMSCTMGALSLNNSSQNCHHLQTSHSSCWQSFFFRLPASLCNLNHGLLTTLCRIPQYQLLNRAKEDRSRIQHLLFNPRATRGFQPFQIPTHLFPRATPPLISTDDPPTLPPTFSHRPFPTDLPRPTSPLPTPPLPTSPPPILPSPSSTSQLQPPSANLPSPCRLSQQEASEHRLSSVSLREPRHYKTRAVISNRYAIACSRSSNSGYRGADNPRHI